MYCGKVAGKWRLGYFLCLIFVLFFFCGCGKTGSGDWTEKESVSAEKSEELTAVSWPKEWKTGDREGISQEAWYVIDCKTTDVKLSMGKKIWNSYTVCRDDTFYTFLEILDTVKQDQGITEVSYQLFAYDIEKEQENFYEVAPGSLTEEGGVALCGFDSCGEDFVCFFTQYEDNKIQHIYTVKINPLGQAGEIRDLLSAKNGCQEILKEEHFLGDCYTDSSGNYWISMDVSTVLALDREGGLLGVLEPESADTVYQYFTKLPDGTPVFQEERRQEKTMSYFTWDGHERKTVGQCENTSALICTAGMDGRLIYADYNGIFSWNVLDGKMCSLYRAKGIQYSDCKALYMKKNGDLTAAFREGSGDQYVFYTVSKREAGTTEITILNLAWADYIQKCAEEYSRKHPGVLIKIEDPKDKEGAWTQLMTRLAATDEGPDMMILGRDKMRVLQKKGVLEDLSEVLKTENKEQIFASVLEYGTLDGKLYGIAGSATVDGFVVLDSVWEKDSWKREDIVSLIREREREGNPIENFCPAGFAMNTGAGTFVLLALENAQESDDIDISNGISRLDREELTELAEICKKYGDSAPFYQKEEERAKALKEGRVLAMRIDGDLITVSKTLSLLGEGCHIIGYPSNTGMGYRLNCNSGCLTVNARSKGKREIIEDFLNYVVSYGAQQKYCLQYIRRDVLTDNVRDKVQLWGNDKPVACFSQSENGVVPLGSREDGTSYLKEYLEILENARPISDEVQDILEFYYQESAAYFTDGTKSAGEMLGILQNRAQLYLNENRE